MQRLLATLVLSVALALSAGASARMQLSAASAQGLALAIATGAICGHGEPGAPSDHRPHCPACVLGGPAPLPQGPAVPLRAARARPLRRRRMRRGPAISRHHPCPHACGPPVRPDLVSPINTGEHR